MNLNQGFMIFLVLNLQYGIQKLPQKIKELFGMV
jgi:hypothetical protein